jgi:CopG family nickel-responsive transcriptional regulator
MIVSSQHIHLDHDNCLEVVAVKGSAVGIRTLAFRLRSAKGVKHGGLIMTTLGSGIK